MEKKDTAQDSASNSELYKILKLGMDNPKKVAAAWFALMAVLSSLGYNVFSFMSYVPKEPQVVLPAEPQVIIKEKIVEAPECPKACINLIIEHESGPLH